MIEVVTVYTPRPKHPKFCDYVSAMQWQKRTAEKFGCRHVVVTDADLPGLDILPRIFPASLMHAILVGQIAYLEQWDDRSPVLLVDADCLIARDPKSAFHDVFDLGLTWRPDPRCMINNGAMYVQAGARERALQFFRLALMLCKEHWGGDQEAISQAAQPDPGEENAIGERNGAVIRFLPMRSHNCAPGREFAKHVEPAPYVVHFKGENRKGWLQHYAEKFILGA